MSLQLRKKEDPNIFKEQIEMEEKNKLFDEREKKIRELIFLLGMMRNQ